MDDARFDAVARLFGVAVGRRALAAGALGALGLLGIDAAAKKKKKKCKKPKVKCGKTCCPNGQKCLAGKCAVPCTFAPAGSVMTLRASCTTASTIEIPDGMTLDGDGKTISAVGNLSGFDLAVVKVSAAENLQVDGQGVTGSCTTGVLAGIEFHGSGGEITGATVRNFACGSGIRSIATPGAIVEATINNVVVGVQVIGPSETTVTDSNISRANIGLYPATEPAVLVATGNTVVGGAGPGVAFAGVYFDGGTSGEAAGNAISGFFDASPTATACGILVAEFAGEVTIGANTFPDPPGNEQDVCDNRP